MIFCCIDKHVSANCVIVPGNYAVMTFAYINFKIIVNKIININAE